MSNQEILIEVIKQFREIFLEKSELKGYDDWDRFLGCIAALQQVADSLTEEETVMDGGELNGGPTD